MGESWCFGLNTVSLLAPIIALSIITTRFVPQRPPTPMLRSLKEGIRFVRRQEAMEALIVLAFLMTFLSMPLRTYFPVFVKDIFHRGPETYGNLLIAHGRRLDPGLVDHCRPRQHHVTRDASRSPCCFAGRRHCGIRTVEDSCR